MTQNGEENTNKVSFGSKITKTLFLSMILRYFLFIFTFLSHSSITSFAKLSVEDSYNVISLLLNLIYFFVAAFIIFALYR